MASTCKEPDCDGPVHGRGMCNAHYRRWKKRGTTELLRQPGGICEVADCPDRSKARGLCNKHYLHWKKYGDPLYQAPVQDDLERFWQHVDRGDPDKCWPWAGLTDASGYGLFYYYDENGQRRRTRAHRWLLGRLRGRPLTRAVVGEEDGCHRCDNPPCCNPAHLYVGTRKQNLEDAVGRSRLWQLRRETCPKGHPLDGVKIQKSGTPRRFCKTCAKEDSHKRRTLDRTTCKNGHPLAGDNILLCKNGTRKCRICEASRRAKVSGARPRAS